jgi:hypothetical protein
VTRCSDQGPERCFGHQLRELNGMPGMCVEVRVERQLQGIPRDPEYELCNRAQDKDRAQEKDRDTLVDSTSAGPPSRHYHV